MIFDNWFRYADLKEMPGGDLFFPAIGEFDDRPGICRYYVARVQRDWMLTLENAARVPGVAAPPGAPESARADAEIRAQRATGKAAVTVAAQAPTPTPAGATPKRTGKGKPHQRSSGPDGSHNYSCGSVTILIVY